MTGVQMSFGFVDDLRHIDNAAIEMKLAGAGAGDVEQILHLSGHVLHLTFDQLLHARQLLTGHPHQSTGDHADGRQGIAQLVGHHRQDFALLFQRLFSSCLQVLCAERGDHQLLVGFAHFQVQPLLLLCAFWFFCIGLCQKDRQDQLLIGLDQLFELLVIGELGVGVVQFLVQGRERRARLDGFLAKQEQLTSGVDQRLLVLAIGLIHDGLFTRGLCPNAAW